MNKKKNPSQKQTHRYREQTDGCQFGGWVKKVKDCEAQIGSYKMITGTYSMA